MPSPAFSTVARLGVAGDRVVASLNGALYVINSTRSFYKLVHASPPIMELDDVLEPAPYVGVQPAQLHDAEVKVIFNQVQAKLQVTVKLLGETCRSWYSRAGNGAVFDLLASQTPPESKKRAASDGDAGEDLEDDLTVPRPSKRRALDDDLVDAIVDRVQRKVASIVRDMLQGYDTDPEDLEDREDREDREDSDDTDSDYDEEDPFIDDTACDDYPRTDLADIVRALGGSARRFSCA